MRVLAFCLMPNHWHLVLWPERGEDLSRFIGWLSQTHTQRWHAHDHNVGTGDQGRFKSFPVEQDDHFYTLVRYVERNALRAGLAERAEEWEWGSLWDRVHGLRATGLLSEWPVPVPEERVERVNAAESESELEAIRRSIKRNRPFGREGWAETTASRLGVGQSLRPLGRPRRRQAESDGLEQRSLFD